MFQKRLDFLRAKQLFFWCFLRPCIWDTFCRFIPCNLSRLSTDEPVWCRRQELRYWRLSGSHVPLLTILLCPILLMMLLVFTVPSQPTSGY